MKVKVKVYTTTTYECELECPTLDEAITEAKFIALCDGDFDSQKAEWEILDPGPEPKPKLVIPTRKPPNRPFIRR